MARPFGHLRQLDAIDDGAAVDVDHDHICGFDRNKRLAGRMADRDPMRGAADIDPLHLVGGGINHQHGVAELARAPHRTRLIHHDAVRRVSCAKINDAGQRLRRQVDDDDAAVRVHAFDENSIAVNRAIGGPPVGGERKLVRRAGHVDGLRQRQRLGIEKMHLVRSLCRNDQIRTAGPVVEIEHVLAFSKPRRIAALRRHFKPKPQTAPVPGLGTRSNRIVGATSNSGSADSAIGINAKRSTPTKSHTMPLRTEISMVLA